MEVKFNRGMLGGGAYQRGIDEATVDIKFVEVLENAPGYRTTFKPIAGDYRLYFKDIFLVSDGTMEGYLSPKLADKVGVTFIVGHKI